MFTCHNIVSTVDSYSKTEVYSTQNKKIGIPYKIASKPMYDGTNEM